MEPIRPSIPVVNAPTAPARLKLTLAQYRAMGEHGILLQRRDSFYADRHPLPADVLLLIEISDSSLHYDRTIKLALYARAGLPRYWIIDVKDRSVIEFTQPWQAGYRSERRLRQGDRLALGEAGSPLEGLTIDVSDLIS